MNPTIHNYGSNFYSPQTGALQGQVKFDANTGLALQPGQSTVIQPNIPSVVPVANISNKPVNLMTPPVATAGVGASAALADQALSVQDQFLRDLQAKQDALGVQQEKQLTGIEDVYSRLFGQGQRNEQIIKDLGVDEAKKELNNYTNQIRAEQNALNNQIKAIASSGGMTKEQAQPQIAELTRQSVSKQADLAVLQGAAADNFDAVSAAADRKIKSETESLQLELQARQFFFQNNKDDFNKAEQRTYEQQNKKIEQEIKNKEIGQQMIVEAVAYGAPQSVIKQAQALYNQGADPTAIQAMLGKYSEASMNAQIKRSQLATDAMQRKNIQSQINERTIKNQPIAVTPEQQQAQLQQIGSKILDTESLIGGKGQAGAVGTSTWSRNKAARFFTGGLAGKGARNDYVAKVENTIQGMTLDQLINAKAEGATFGALSDAELQLLAKTASVISGYPKIKDKNGNVIGYEANEKDFNEQLQKIVNLGKKDYLLKGGDLESVGAIQMPDGSVWVTNKDGSKTQLN